MGCIYISGVVEYDDCVESLVCDEFVKSVMIWCVVLVCVIVQVKEEGYLCVEVDL